MVFWCQRARKLYPQIILSASILNMQNHITQMYLHRTLIRSPFSITSISFSHAWGHPAYSINTPKVDLRLVLHLLFGCLANKFFLGYEPQCQHLFCCTSSKWIQFSNITFINYLSQISWEICCSLYISICFTLCFYVTEGAFFLKLPNPISASL